jgi:hypothetical protein
VASQCCNGEKEKWDVADVYRLTDLNKCCSKDVFPLARIDQIIDSIAVSEMMALLDCFSGYHQICLHIEDKEKTSFITPFKTYCYLKMPEGLHNIGPTFFRKTKAALKDQVGRNVLSYVNNIVIASKKRENYISNLTETFANMREAKLRLNKKNMCSESQGERSSEV